MSPVDGMGGGLRKRRTGFFVQVPRETIRDEELSFKSRGILTFLLDMPDGWDVKSEWIAKQSKKDGRDAVQTGLLELRVRGYYRLERRRLLDGTLVMGTAISETSVPEWVEQNAAFSNKPVLCVQQADGSFKVKMPDGTLVDDGFEGLDTADSDPTDGQELTVDEQASEGSGATLVTGTGFSGPGESGSGDTPGTGTGFSDFGSAGVGEPRAIREKETGDREGEEPSLRSGSSGGGGALIDIKAITQPEVDEAGTPLREDVERVCTLLADLIEANGSKRPTVTKRWRDEARRLMDIDARTEVQVTNMIRWSQDDPFWKANILSMPKLREKYDTMRLRAMEETKGRPGYGSARKAYNDAETHGTADERAAALEARNAMTDEERAAQVRAAFGQS